MTLEEFVANPPKELRVYPDPILTSPTGRLKNPDLGLLKSVRLIMLDLMYRNGGLGLAGPQVGLPYKLFVLHVARNDEPLLIYNPEIVELSKARTVALEGCLSLPGINLPVSRPKEVTMRFMTPDGLRTRSWKGLRARTAQHELDHCNGILILHRGQRVA